MLPKNQQLNQMMLNQFLEAKIGLEDEKSTTILLDADRTLSEIDSSRILNDYAGIDLQRIKSKFQEFGYTFEGFYNNALIYSELDTENFIQLSKKVADEINLYPGVVNFINEIKSFANVIVVTAGIKQIWKKVLENNGISKDVLLIGGLHDRLDDYIIGKDEKGYICDFLKKLGKRVIAFGDSGVDTLMLQKADVAVIVINHRNNWDLISELVNHKKLYQISYKDFTHPNIENYSYESFIEKIKSLINENGVKK